MQQVNFAMEPNRTLGGIPADKIKHVWQPMSWTIRILSLPGPR